MHVAIGEGCGTMAVREERMMYTYYPSGVCSKQINIELDGDVIDKVEFIGGCKGNLAAISILIKGRTVEEIAEMLDGNTCGDRPTSCADQLSRALREALAAEGRGEDRQGVDPSDIVFNP